MTTTTNSLVGVQPVTNGSGRHIGTRYVLTVEAAQGLRDALADSSSRQRTTPARATRRGRSLCDGRRGGGEGVARG